MPKTVFAILLFFLFGNPAQTQNSKIDSLDRLIIKAKTDTAKINLSIKKISILNEVNLDSAISYSKKTIEGAKKINYKKGILDYISVYIF